MKICPVILLFLSLSAFAQNLSKSEIKAAAKAKLPNAIEQLNEFLRLPNNGKFPDQVDQNLNWCQKTFNALGFTTQILKTDGAPLLYAEKIYNKNLENVLFYLQIDGQPVDTAAWEQESPFIPVLKEKTAENTWKTIPFPDKSADLDLDWRIFARSVSDSKGPAMSFIAALQIMQRKKIKPRFNIKVIMDFQEELGSPYLPKAVEEHKSLFEAKYLLVMDGTRHVSNLPTLTFGARGIATARLTVFGPRYALHSGQYGNFAPNPVFKTAKLLAGLKDENGKVTLPGFYDGIDLSVNEKEILNNVPEHKDSIKKRIGVAKADAVGHTYQEALQYPSLNIRGLNAGWVGDKVRTIIPEEVNVEIDMRLVPESNGERLMESLKEYIVNQGFHLVDTIPTEQERGTYPKLARFTYKLGSKPFRTEMDSAIGDFLSSAMARIYGQKFVKMRTTGGSQPMAAFIKTLDIPAVSVRIPNPDNNIHGPNENFRLGNFLEGIEMCLAILNEPLD